MSESKSNLATLVAQCQTPRSSISAGGFTKREKDHIVELCKQMPGPGFTVSDWAKATLLDAVPTLEALVNDIVEGKE